MAEGRFSLGEMTAGGWVSGVSHVALITWLLAGWGMTSEPLDFEVTSIQTVSGEDYARLVAATSPQPATDLGAAPETPVTEEAPPPPETPPEEPAPATPAPQPETPAAEAPPPPPPEPVPQPADVQDAPPELAVPEAFVPPPAPESLARPQARPAPRVAAEAVAPPPPEADVAPEVQQEASTEAESAEVVEEAAEATAPEEAATEIVTEAETPSGAPETALRPQTRPTRPTPTAPAEEPAEEPAETPSEAPATAEADTSVDDALAAALAAEVASDQPATDSGAAAANPGPPMTGAETDAFRIAVSGCWAVDPGSAAARVVVTVGFELDRDGRVIGDVRLVNAQGDDAGGAAEVAFQAARRAILRCQSQSGYQLPDDKYEQWRQVEMTFDPSGMRIR